MTPIKSGLGIAATAALLALSAAASTPAFAAHDTKVVHCYGVNSCKGTSDCKSFNHECKGQNACKGQGFKAESAKQCAADGGSLTNPSDRFGPAGLPPRAGHSFPNILDVPPMTLPSFSGFGLGLRKPHYGDFLERQVPVDFVEVISENFMVDGGRPRDILRRVRERYPVAMHGVSMSLGSADGLDRDYLKRLRQLADALDPLFISDHLSWSRFEGFSSHDLLPLPYTEEVLDLVCTNLAMAQDVLGRAMLVENPSSYLSFDGSTMSEWEFLDAMCTRTGCGLLLDVNNIVVSAANHGFDALAYLAGIPASRVRQIHLAGHMQGQDLLIDTHDQPVPNAVWGLFEAAVARVGPVATMIERDDHIPPLAELLAELEIARAIGGGLQQEAA